MESGVEVVVGAVVGFECGIATEVEAAVVGIGGAARWLSRRILVVGVVLLLLKLNLPKEADRGDGF